MPVRALLTLLSGGEPQEDQGEDGEQRAATTYRVLRSWRDGETMEPHLVAGPFDNLGEAVKACEYRGGYVVRDSDGAILTPKGWIDAYEQPEKYRQ